MGVVPAQDPGPGKAITKIDELNTHTVKPTKGSELKPSRGTMYNLVPSKEKGWHHRSVLGEVTRMKDGRSKNLTRMRNVPPKCTTCQAGSRCFFARKTSAKKVATTARKQYEANNRFQSNATG
jgi:hypothetical protein